MTHFCVHFTIMSSKKKKRESQELFIKVMFKFDLCLIVFLNGLLFGYDDDNDASLCMRVREIAQFVPGHDVRDGQPHLLPLQDPQPREHTHPEVGPNKRHRQVHARRHLPDRHSHTDAQLDLRFHVLSLALSNPRASQSAAQAVAPRRSRRGHSE